MGKTFSSSVSTAVLGFLVGMHWDSKCLLCVTPEFKENLKEGIELQGAVLDLEHGIASDYALKVCMDNEGQILIHVLARLSEGEMVSKTCLDRAIVLANELEEVRVELGLTVTVMHGAPYRGGVISDDHLGPH